MSHHGITHQTFLKPVRALPTFCTAYFAKFARFNLIKHSCSFVKHYFEICRESEHALTQNVARRTRSQENVASHIHGRTDIVDLDSHA